MRTLPIAMLLMLIPGMAAWGGEVIAHRGVHQQVDSARAGDGCSTSYTLPSDHDYLENTLASMQAAFDAGADWVEMDLRVTADRQVVVFDDRMLDCRTDGSGPVRATTLDDLRRFDVGYGYSIDGGETYPFRCGADDVACRARHRISTLQEVLAAFPERRFVLNLKGRSVEDADTVIDRLRAGFADGSMNPDHLMFFSSRAPAVNTRVQEALPDLAVPRLVRSRMDLCLAGFARTGAFQDDCIGQDIAVSVARMDAMGPQAQRLAAAVHHMEGTLHVYGVDSEAAYRFAQSLSPDFIWTDRIEALGL